MYSIQCNVSKTGDNTAKVSWGTNPESDSAITGCIEAYRYTVAGSTLVYENCTSTESEIERAIPASGYEYTVRGRIEQDGYYFDCQDVLTFGYDQTTADRFGLGGIIAIFFLVAAMVLLFSNEQPKWFPVMAGVGLLIAFVMGIMAVGWMPTASLIFLILIVLWVGRHHRQPT
jgi:hypothetical protein